MERRWGDYVYNVENSWKTFAHVKTRETKTVNPSKRGFVINVKSRSNNRTVHLLPDRVYRVHTGIPDRKFQGRRNWPTKPGTLSLSRGDGTFRREKKIDARGAPLADLSPRWLAEEADEGLISDRERYGRTWKEREKKKKEEEGKKADHPPLRDFSRYHLSLSLSPFEFLKRRRHRCLLDNSVRHARMTGRRQTRRDGSTSKRCILEYAHVQVVLLVHIRLIDGASKSRVQPRATRVGDSSKRNLVSF